LAKIADKLPEVTDSQWQLINKFNRDITKEFLEESTQLSTKTLISYNSCLRIFFWWVYENCEDKSIINFKSRDFLKYQNFLVRRGLSSSSIRIKRAAVSSLNGYILTYYEDDYKEFKNFITKKIPAPPKADVHEKKPMNDVEWNNLLKTLEEREDWQKIAYLKFTYASGCRRAETRQILKDVVNAPLIEKEVDLKNKDGVMEKKIARKYITSEIRCKGKGKAGKPRRLQFDIDAMDAIKKWLEVRGEDDIPYLFVVNYKGLHQCSEGVFNDWCKDDFAKIVGRRVHPHQLREQRATNMVVNEGKSLDAVKSLLGHESTETSKIYVIRENDDSSDEAFV